MEVGHKGSKNLLPAESSSEGEQLNEIAPNEDPNEGPVPEDDEQDNAEADQEHDSDRHQKGNEDLLEEVSEQGSELFETDSSNDQEGSFGNADNQNSSLGSEKILTVDGQGRDIVAGSPTKIMAQQDEP